MTSWTYDERLGGWFRCDARRRPADSERYRTLPPAKQGDTFAGQDAQRLTVERAGGVSVADGGRTPYDHYARPQDAPRDALRPGHDHSLHARTERARRALAGDTDQRVDARERAAATRRAMER